MGNTQIRYIEETGSTDRNYPMNALRLCIDQYGDDIQGRIYSRMSAAPLIFTNLSEMLLRADMLFDQRGYPQAFQEKRSFRKSEILQGRYKVPQPVLDAAEVLRQRGSYYTLDVVVQSRRRAGWQGRVLCRSGGLLFEYRSEMELLNGMFRELQKKSQERKSDQEKVNL